MGELKGILTALVTPFDSAGELDLNAVSPLLRFQREAGVQGVVIGGTNGEGPSLSAQERIFLLEAVQNSAGSLKVVAAVGAASVVDAVTLVTHASRSAADAALVLPPFFFKNPPVQGLVEYFRRVLDASTIPVLLYSIPQHSAVPITDEILSLLGDHPRLAGLKDSAGIWERTHELIVRYPGLQIFPGTDRFLSLALEHGASGIITGGANGFPHLITEVYGTLLKGGDAASGQKKLDEMRDILAEYPLIAVSKSILAHRGLPRMHVRPPLVDLTAAQEQQLISSLRRLELL